MFKILDEKCTPTKGSRYSACIDLYARKDFIIGAGETAKVPLGICLDYDNFPIYLKNNLNKFYLQLEPRSSIRAKGLQAGSGIIDIDYEDEIMIILHNPLDTYKTFEYDNFEIKKGDKIAQIMLCEHKSFLFDIDTKEVRTGGFGSTDK